MIITKASEADFLEILNLSKLLDLSESGKEEKIKQALANQLVWVAKDKKKIVGYILCQLFRKEHKELPNSIFIADLYISKLYQKQGIGKELVQTVLNLKFPKQYNYFSITHDPVEVNLTEFYCQFGFEVMGQTKAGNVKMIKKI